MGEATQHAGRGKPPGYHSGMSNDAGPPPYYIASVDHALRLLLMLQKKSTIRVAQAADELAVARSTAHRLLAMLVYREFAVQDTVTRAYRPGPFLIEVGMGAISHLDVRRKARPFLERIAESTGETASLQILEGTSARFVDSVESTDAVRVGSRAGVSLPAHVASGGRVLLSMLSDETLRRLYPEDIIETGTNFPPMTREHLMEEIATTREHGYSVNPGESQSGMVAVGVGLASRDGEPMAALTVAGPTPRMGPDKIESIVQGLRAAVKELGDTIYSA